jgi:hypothetical protein
VPFKHPSPATVLASIALLVSLSGTAIAAGAVPLAKKALFARNAGKLQGKTARQVARIPGPATRLNGLRATQIAAMPGPATTLNGLTASEIAATPGPATTLGGKSLAEVAAIPGPASTASGLVSVISAPFTIDPGANGGRSATCPTGETITGGGWTANPRVDDAASAPTWDNVNWNWTVYLFNESSTETATGYVYAICMR